MRYKCIHICIYIIYIYDVHCILHKIKDISQTILMEKKYGWCPFPALWHRTAVQFRSLNSSQNAALNLDANTVWNRILTTRSYLVFQSNMFFHSQDIEKNRRFCWSVLHQVLKKRKKTSPTQIYWEKKHQFEIPIPDPKRPKLVMW